MTFTRKSIHAILRTSRACGVAFLKWGDLEVRFQDTASQPESRNNEFLEFADSSARDSAPEGEHKPPKVQRDLVEHFAEEQELLDDPLAFESRQIDRFIDGAAGGNEET